MMSETPQVFISYSPEIEDLGRAVLDLANQLRGDGIRCQLDQDVRGTPPEGWPRWMHRAVESADYVLVVCTKTYKRRFEGKDERGKGADWEGLLIAQELYEQRSRSAKFIPILPEGAGDEDIPLPLKPYTHYRIPADYEKLCRFLTGSGGAPDSGPGDQLLDSGNPSTVVSTSIGIVPDEAVPKVNQKQSFPELRESEIARWATEVSSLEASRIVFINGAPTSGKSHVCNFLIEHLNHFHGASAHSFEARDGEPLARRILSVVGGGFKEPEIADVPVWLARFQSRFVIHISNCHSLSDADINYLLSLFRELGARNWGRVQFLLEFRSPTGNTAWENLVAQTHEAFHGCRDISIPPLTATDIVKAISKICLPGQEEDIASALIAKAGLDPLSLDTVLRILLIRGAFRWVSQDGSMHLRVEDRALFEQRLAELPGELDVMLRERILVYIAQAHAREGERLPIAERLALLAAVGPDFDQERLARALRLTPMELRRMDADLEGEKFLVYVGDEGQVDFSHDTIRLAAESYGRETGVVKEPAEWLLGVLNPDNALELIIAGTLQMWLTGVTDAMVYYRSALQAASDRADYPLHRAALEACVSAAERVLNEDRLEPFGGIISPRDLIDWHIDLGWIEMQSGSQTQALTHYEEAERRTLALLRDETERNTEGLQTQYTRIRQRILTCLVDRQRIGACLTLLESLIPEITDQTVLVDTLNRYLLLCVATGQAGSGFDAARLGVGLAEILGADSQSVMLSDVGHLYLFESPVIAARLWEDSLATAQHQRQRTHAQANQLIGDLLANRKRKGVTFQALLQAVHAETGTVIQLTRLYMYAGTRAAISGNLTSALRYFSLASTNAMTHGQVSHAWEAENNLGVVYLAMGKINEAGRYLESSAERIHALIVECDKQRIQQLYSMLGDKAAELWGLKSQMFNNRVSSLSKPNVTGMFWYLLYNVETWEMSRRRGAIRRDLWQSKDHAAFDAAFEIIARKRNPLLLTTSSGVFTLALS